MSEISETTRYQKKYKTVHGKKMAYIDEGEGDPIVFLHGMPTSSFLWRNVMPYMEGKGRLVAPDLIGYGDSDKLDDSGPDRYTFVEHRKFLFALLDELGVHENVTLVIHDWGSILGFHWAYQNQESLKAIAHMESMPAPLLMSDMPAENAEALRGIRSPAGEKMMLEENQAIEGVLPMCTLRTLTDAEMDEYRRPFLEPGEGRRPTLTFPRQVPFDGEPAEVNAMVAEFSEWMAASDLPKIFVNAEPGLICRGRLREFLRTWKNQTEVTVKGHHFLQEDAPHEIGQALAEWYSAL